MTKCLDIVILGLSITSSWGNGHATTFRGLVKALHGHGHRVHFLERDVPWYASNRDLPEPPFCTTSLYNSTEALRSGFGELVGGADLVILGSYVPDGVAVGDFISRTADGVTAFYDIDTPVTFAKLAKDDFEYLHPQLISQFDLYLSFTGGPILDRIENEFGSPAARPFYCSFDPALYYPEEQREKWDLGYLGTYSGDRQPPLQELMLTPAAAEPGRKFVVAGPQYPSSVEWPGNVERIEHLPPSVHRKFYNQQRFTLNITRADMIEAGYSPSVRLFEAAACGTPIISDWWQGLDTIFQPGEEIFISRSANDTIRFLRDVPEERRKAVGARARQLVLEYHTAEHRAIELENYYNEALCRKEMALPSIQSLQQK